MADTIRHQWTIAKADVELVVVKRKKKQLQKLSRVTPEEAMVRYKRHEGHFRYEGYLNNRYSVQISDEATDWGLVVHLWIQRHDGDMVRSWADMQRIKNELVGPNRVGVEVFPPVKELLDQANIAHIWVMPEGFVLPFTLKRGTIT
jgi:hypothetical protein